MWPQAWLHEKVRSLPHSFPGTGQPGVVARNHEIKLVNKCPTRLDISSLARGQNRMSPIANMLSQLKNAQTAGADRISVPFSRIKFEIAQILKEKDYIADVEKKKRKLGEIEANYLDIKMKPNDGAGAINGIRLVSKPSRRIYAKKPDLKPVKSGYGIAVISTSKGLMTGENAKKAGLGGEVIFEIW